MNQFGIINYGIKKYALIILVSLCACANLSFSQNSRHTQQAKTPGRLGAAGVQFLYDTWAKSFIEKDIKMWQKLTSAHQQRSIENQLLSRRRDFPKDVFVAGIPNLINLEGLNMVSLTQGEVAAKALFFGDLKLLKPKSNESKILASQSLYFIDLYAEQGWWKISKVGVLDLRHQPELKKQLLQYQFEPVYLPIPKSLPKPAPLLSKADYIGNAWVESKGVLIELAVNGKSLAPVADNKVAHLILGGLKQGENKIKYRVKSEDKQQLGELIAVIEIFALSEKRGNKPIALWSLDRASKNNPPDSDGFYTAIFTLSAEQATKL